MKVKKESGKAESLYDAKVREYMSLHLNTSRNVPQVVFVSIRVEKQV